VSAKRKRGEEKPRWSMLESSWRRVSFRPPGKKEEKKETLPPPSDDLFPGGEWSPDLRALRRKGGERTIGADSLKKKKRGNSIRQKGKGKRIDLVDLRPSVGGKRKKQGGVRFFLGRKRGEEKGEKNSERGWIPFQPWGKKEDQRKMAFAHCRGGGGGKRNARPSISTGKRAQVGSTQNRSQSRGRKKRAFLCRSLM